jgi:DMSO/TMAO reductase YedYZ molybdopterin-dependent catalytic subunit
LAQGALGGGLLTAPMIGLMYVLDQMTGLPFVPFMLFDWITRVLPGGLVTFGIDSMIDVMNMLGMSVASSAKTAEQIVAILFFLLIGIVLGAVYFAVMRKLGVAPRAVAGVILGIGFGVPMIAVSLPMAQSGTSPLFTIMGLGALFLVWGLAFIPVYRKLVYSGTDLEIEHEIRWAQSINRRQFLVRLGASAATVTVVSAGLGTVLAQREQRLLEQATSDEAETVPRRPLPNDGDPVTPAPGTRPEFTAVEDHYKVFIRSSPTEIDITTWSLPITGLVANPMVLSLDDIRNKYESRDQYVTLSCISGRIGTDLISTTWWTGVSLQKILADVQPQADARYLIITSGDGFYETVSLDLIASDERIMLCYEWDGKPLPFDHGFPLRIWLPDRYGMKQPKWITGIEVTAEYVPGYWVERDWDEVARVKATSVIDTVAVHDLEVVDGQGYIPVGGIAFAGARGVSRVEVRVDGGAWEEAKLRSPLSETTWVIWRYEWPFQEGEHTFEVRCAEADGTPQIEENKGNRPDGASGIHRRKTKI